MNERRMAGTVLLGLASLATGACGDELPQAPRDGVYRSVGYGLVLTIRGGDVTLLDESDAACRTGAGELLAAPEIRDAVLAATRSAHGGLAVRFPWTATPIHFEPLPALPDACASERIEIAGEPGYVADLETDARVLCAELGEHYAFGAARGVDLGAACDQLLAAPADSADDAFDAYVALLAQLADPHVSLSDPSGQRSWSGGRRPSIAAQVLDSLPADASDAAIAAAFEAATAAIVAARESYLDDAATSPIPGVLSAGIIAGRTGYLALDALQLRGDALDFPAQADELGAALDEALAPMRDLPAVILDLRANGGGSDRLSVAVAQRFATRRLRVHKRVYERGALLDPRAIDVPASAAAYRGELVILTSDLTVSAAEVLALLLAERPHTRRVGDTTAGAFSDQLFKALPSGLILTLSNERYEDDDGECFEVRGLAPDLAVEAYELAALNGGRDGALEAALGVLGGR